MTFSSQITSLPATTKRLVAFADWISEYCTSESLVLDIGAGHDRTGIDAVIAPRVKRLVGVDPSEDILMNQVVHERHHATIEDFANESQHRFDIIFATMVLEHVSDPTAFFAATRRLLKPGGMFFALTPNLWHYFGLATKISASLGIEDWLLDRLMGRAVKETYHFPTTYRANSIRTIKHLLGQAGFQAVEFRCSDNPTGYRYVIPTTLRWFTRLYSWLVYRFHLTLFMGRLIFRVRG